MYRDCLYTYIRDLKCKYASLIIDYNKALSHGTRKAECLELQSNLLYMYIKMMQCYVTFEEAQTFIASITINKEVGVIDTITIGIIGGATESFSYTGNGTNEEIVSYFVDLINSTSTDFQAEQSGSTLYIFTSSINYSLTSTLNTTSANSVTEFISNIDLDLESDIMALWNCINEEELESIIEHSYRILNNRNVTTDCGCGC